MENLNSQNIRLSSNPQALPYRHFVSSSKCNSSCTETCRRLLWTKTIDLQHLALSNQDSPSIPRAQCWWVFYWTTLRLWRYLKFKYLIVKASVSCKKYKLIFSVCTVLSKSVFIEKTFGPSNYDYEHLGSRHHFCCHSNEVVRAERQSFSHLISCSRASCGRRRISPEYCAFAPAQQLFCIFLQLFWVFNVPN